MPTKTYKAAVIEVGEPAPRERGPDTPVAVREKRIDKVIGKPIGLAENGGFSVLPPGQTIVSRYPNTPFRACSNRQNILAGQALFRRDRCDGELSKAVKSAGAGKPNIAFAILKKTAANIARKPVRFPEHVCPAMMYVDKPPLVGSDPEPPITVSQELVRIDVVIRKQRIPIGRAINTVWFELVPKQALESCSADSN